MTRGRYRLAGTAVEDLADDALTRLRRSTLGFVFQFHHLLPAFSALENVTMPALLRDGRVLARNPALVLADEPTGNLDTASSDEVFALLRRMHAQVGTSFLVVTHDPRLAARCNRIIELVDGRIARDDVQPSGAYGG